MIEKPEKIRRIFAQNIKKRRENLGLSQEKLAESAGLSVQTINTIEGCRMWISDKTLVRLAKVLNIEIFQLFVPYETEKCDFNPSPSSVLLELRQKILTDVNEFSTNIDFRINEALKSSSPRQNEERMETQKPVRQKTKRHRH
jgi:transcriptional regulator with XRE-family HTH domain